MSLNTKMLFPVGSFSYSGVINTALAAATTADGTDPHHLTLFTNDDTAADSFWSIRELRIDAMGANAGAVLRIYDNNGLDSATRGNNAPLTQVLLPTTPSLSPTTLSPFIIVRRPFREHRIVKGHALRLGVSIAATDGWFITANLVRWGSAT